MMVGFIAVAVAQVGLGGLLIWRRPDKLVLIAALGLMLGSVGMWLMSRTSGLPFLPGGHMEPIGFKDSVTVLFELATVPGLLLLMSPDLGAVRLPSARLGSQGLALLSVGAFMLFVPALMLDGGSHHAAGQAGHPHADGGGHKHGEGQTLKADADHHAAGGGATSDHAHGKGANGASKSSHGKDGHGHEGSGGGNAQLAQADTEAPHGDHAHGGSGSTGGGGRAFGRVRVGRLCARRPRARQRRRKPRPRRHERAQEPEQGEGRYQGRGPRARQGQEGPRPRRWQDRRGQGQRKGEGRRARPRRRRGREGHRRRWP